MSADGVRFILTGPPGIGKTTAVKAVSALLEASGVSTLGFYTEEVRENGTRIGFDAVNLNGSRSPLARIDASQSKHRVGKYSVYVDRFERDFLPVFHTIAQSPDSVVIIDEVGKMELLSSHFRSQVEKLFESRRFIVATIPINKGKPIPVVETIRSDRRNKIINVDFSNRGQIPEIIFDEITKMRSSS